MAGAADTPYVPPVLCARGRITQGLGYDPLLDKNLTGYLRSKRMYRHLRKSGLVTKDGHIVDQQAYRDHLNRREQRQRLRDELADTICHAVIQERRLLEAQHTRQIEAEFQQARVEEIRRRSAIKPKDVRDIELAQVVFGTVPVALSSASITLRRTSGSLTDMQAGETLTPGTRPGASPGSYKKSRRAASADTTRMTLARDGGSHRPLRVASAQGSSALEKRSMGDLLHESTLSRRRALCQPSVLWLAYEGAHGLLQNEPAEVVIKQQPSGGAAIVVFRGHLPAGSAFSFASRRNGLYPLGLTIFINGLSMARVSTCCEYKHTVRSFLGSRNAGIRLLRVEGGQPCAACRLAAQQTAQIVQTESDVVETTRANSQPLVSCSFDDTLDSRDCDLFHADTFAEDMPPDAEIAGLPTPGEDNGIDLPALQLPPALAWSAARDGAPPMRVSMSPIPLSFEPTELHPDVQVPAFQPTLEPPPAAVDLTPTVREPPEIAEELKCLPPSFQPKLAELSQLPVQMKRKPQPPPPKPKRVRNHIRSAATESSQPVDDLPEPPTSEQEPPAGKVAKKSWIAPAEKRADNPKLALATEKIAVTGPTLAASDESTFADIKVALSTSAQTLKGSCTKAGSAAPLDLISLPAEHTASERSATESVQQLEAAASARNPRQVESEAQSEEAGSAHCALAPPDLRERQSTTLASEDLDVNVTPGLGSLSCELGPTSTDNIPANTAAFSAPKANNASQPLSDKQHKVRLSNKLHADEVTVGNLPPQIEPVGATATATGHRVLLRGARRLSDPNGESPRGVKWKTPLVAEQAIEEPSVEDIASVSSSSEEVDNDIVFED